MNKLHISICIPAYNEEQNIHILIDSIDKQKLNNIFIDEIVIVSSGSTDRTESIVEDCALHNPKIILIKQKIRKGKASAINEFLKRCKNSVIVLLSADIILSKNTIENLCREFNNDHALGLTGGAPYPLNNRNTIIGYLIHTWWWLHRNIPRFGEIIAFRNVIKKIPETTAVDEAYIQAWFEKGGYRLAAKEDAIVFNKGPETIRELIEQRRRIFIGHSILKKQIGYKVDSLNINAIKSLLMKLEIKHYRELIWLFIGINIEIYSRIIGFKDMHFFNNNPAIWNQIKSTKNLGLLNFEL